MQAVSKIANPIVKSVLIVAATMVAIWLAFAAAYYAFEWAAPNSAGSANTVVSTIAGISWFAQKSKRRMANGERMWFAVGVSVVNCLLPAAYVVGSLIYIKLPVSVANVDLVWGGGKGYIGAAFIAWVLIIAFAFSFVQAYLFARFLPRKLQGNVAPA